MSRSSIGSWGCASRAVRYAASAARPRVAVAVPGLEALEGADEIADQSRGQAGLAEQVIPAGQRHLGGGIPAVAVVVAADRDEQAGGLHPAQRGHRDPRACRELTDAHAASERHGSHAAG